MSLLQLDNVSVSHGGVLAVAGVSLTVEPGEVLGILGRNGAGKSSLLSGIAGMVPASGTIRFDGRVLGRSSAESRARRGLALVAEGRGVLDQLTVAENLTVGAFPAGRLARGELAERIEDSYRLFPILRERADAPAGVLSGGEAAMLVIARALMSRPRLLLLDEPTLGLAPKATSAVFERLQEIKRQGTTMVVVEQKAADLLALVDRVALLQGGELVYQGAAGELSLDALRDLYFGGEQTPAVTTAATRGGA